MDTLSIISLRLSEVKTRYLLMKKKDLEQALSSGLAKHDVEPAKSFADELLPVLEHDHANSIHFAHDLAERIFNWRQMFWKSPDASPMIRGPAPGLVL